MKIEPATSNTWDGDAARKFMAGIQQQHDALVAIVDLIDTPSDLESWQVFRRIQEIASRAIDFGPGVSFE